MNRYGLTKEQEKLLLDLIQCDKEKTPEKGFILTVAGDNKIMIPHCFGLAAVFLHDLEALCDAGLLVREREKSDRSYRIKNEAYEVAKTLEQQQWSDAKPDNKEEIVGDVVNQVLRKRYGNPSDKIVPASEWVKPPVKVTFKVANVRKFTAWLDSHNRGSPIGLATWWHRGNAFVSEGEPFPVCLDPLVRREETYTYIKRYVWQVIENTGDMRDEKVVGNGIRFDVDDLHSEGGEVEAKCLVLDTVLVKIFHNLLKDAARRFPEIQEQLQVQGLTWDETEVKDRDTAVSEQHYRNEGKEEQLEYVAEEQSWYPGDFSASDKVGPEQLARFQQEVDAVLMVATEGELRAVLHLLQPYPRRKRVLQAYVGAETYYLGRFGAYKTAVTRCTMGSGGERGSALATPEAIRNWQPKAIIMPGIAFGKSPDNQKMADVLVASQIIPYEKQRLGQELIFRDAIPSSNATLQNRFENALDWHFKRPDGQPCALCIGSILSGEKLVDDPKFKASLFERFPEAIGGEMEGAGLAAAAGRDGVPWILVKAICDWADGQKHGRHQPLAAAAAVSLVHHVLSQQGVLP